MNLEELMMSRLLPCLLLVLILTAPSRAEKNATIETSLVGRSSLVVDQSFDAPLAKPMQAAKGQWETKQGVLVGKELAADKHAAVLNFQKKNRNSVVRFSFKLDGKTNGFHFSLNKKGGHLFRVVVSPSKLAINLDKDKKDPQSKVIVLDSAKGQFQKGQWYTMQVEMVADRVVVQTDNGVSAKATHAGLDTEKPNYRFVMRGDSLSIDDLKVWEVR
jgi:hypothetical protein